jgi:hypothetical protein
VRPIEGRETGLDEPFWEEWSMTRKHRVALMATMIGAAMATAASADDFPAKGRYALYKYKDDGTIYGLTIGKVGYLAGTVCLDDKGPFANWSLVTADGDNVMAPVIQGTKRHQISGVWARFTAPAAVPPYDYVAMFGSDMEQSGGGKIVPIHNSFVFTQVKDKSGTLRWVGTWARKTLGFNALSNPILLVETGTGDKPGVDRVTPVWVGPWIDTKNGAPNCGDDDASKFPVPSSFK